MRTSKLDDNCPKTIMKQNLRSIYTSYFSPFFIIIISYYFLLIFLHYDSGFNNILNLGCASLSHRGYYIIYNSIAILIDAIIFTCITLIGTKRTVKWTAPFVGGAILIFCATATIYQRYFGRYFDITLFSVISDIESRADSFTSLILPKDIIVWIGFLILFFIGLRHYLRMDTNYLKVLFGWCLCLLPVSFIYAWFLTRHTEYNLYDAYFYRYIKNYRPVETREESGFCFGVINLAIQDCLSSSNPVRELTDTDKALWASYRRESYFCDTPIPRNVIMIVCESLISDAINRQFDDSLVMPRLNNIILRSAITEQRVTTFEHCGVSSDGQLILMTGVLPHTIKIVANCYNENTMYGLGSLLKKQGLTTTMIIPDPATAWNTHKMAIMYGIDNLIEANRIDNTFSTDAEVFSVAKETIQKIKENPFFLSVVTISMHMPYNEKFDSALCNYRSNTLTSNYLTSLVSLKKCKNSLYMSDS